MAEPVTIQLSSPFDHGSEHITEITLQPPKGKHIRDMPAEPGMGWMLTLASRISGQPPSVFDAMEASDVIEVATVAGNFLNSSRATGPK